MIFRRLFEPVPTPIWPATVVVLAANSWLPAIAADLAQATEVSRSFIGTVFMALVTTMPKMAVAISALRLRALDTAIGDLLGSRLFDVVVGDSTTEP